MKAPSMGPKDLVYYAAFIGATVAMSFTLRAFGINGIARTLGAIAVGWVVGFLVDRIIKRGDPE